MYHTVEFVTALFADLETSPSHPLKRIRIRKGTRRKAEIKPYVVERDKGPVEVADLFFEDGTATRMVPFEDFTLVDA